MTIRCPICHSDYIKYHKVWDKNGTWWSRCISGLDHGIIEFPNGHRIDIGITYSQVYFTDDGLVEYEGMELTILAQDHIEVEFA